MNSLIDLITNPIQFSVKKYKIKDICLVTRGRIISKMELQENIGEYPVYSSQTLNDGVFGRINTYDYDGEYVQWTTDGANAGSIFYRNGKFSVTNVCGLLKIKDEYQDKVYAKYLAYILSQESKKYVNYATSNPKLMSNVVEKIEIIIPTIDIQEEIIKILDQFNSLQSELQNELSERKNQYKYWSNKLLNNKEFKLKKLEDIASFSQGIQVDPTEQYDYCSDDMVPFLRIVDFVKDDEPPRYIKKPDDKYMKKENDEIVMIRYGASAAGKVFINKSGAIANNMFKINIFDNEIDVKYLWYYLSQDKIYNKLNNKSGGSTMPAINFKLAASIDVVVPPIEKQKEIVKILDRFENLINNSVDGLPAEINLRKKQYEYYKNEILSFKGVVDND